MNSGVPDVSTHHRTLSPLRNIGLQAYPPLLPVIGNVDAGLALLLHDEADAAFDLLGQGRAAVAKHSYASSYQ
jgi:hypothetical protein